MAYQFFLVAALKPAINCFQHLEVVIKSRIPGLQSLITKTISELETELSRLGKPVAADAGVSIFFIFGYFLLLFQNTSLVNTHSLELQGKLYMIMEICRAFDQTFKEHLDGT